MIEDRTTARDSLATVSKALKLLSLIGSSDTELKLSELSRRLGFSKTVTHRLVGECLRHRYLYQNDSSKAYGIGPEAFRVGIRFFPYYSLSYMTRQSLREVAKEAGHTTYVGILDDTKVLVIAAFNGGSSVRVESISRGDTLPVLSTALGKALLSSLPEDEQREILLRVRHSDDEQVDVDKYVRSLASARASGYALSKNEYDKHVTSIAAVVDARLHGIPMGLAISVPSVIVNKKLTKELSQIVLAAAAKVRQSLSKSTTESFD